MPRCGAGVFACITANVLSAVPERKNTRPEASEIAPHAKIYVDLVPGEDVLETLSTQIQRSRRAFESMGEQRAGSFMYAPGKWTAKQVLGHLIDTERIFDYRVLRIARGDSTPLSGFEQNDYVLTAGSEERSLDDLIDEFQIVRQSSLKLFRSLPPEAWDRRGQVSDWSLTVRGIVFTTAGHELHHYRILQDRYLA